MSANPSFASTPRFQSGLVPSTADTSLTAPTHVTSVFSAGASGSRIDIIRIIQVATTASTAIVNMFLYDGTTYHLFDQFTAAAFTVSATAEQQPVEIPYSECVFPSGVSLVVSVTTAAGQSAFNVVAWGGDF